MALSDVFSLVETGTQAILALALILHYKEAREMAQAIRELRDYLKVRSNSISAQEILNQTGN